jgi:hypothetical protein
MHENDWIMNICSSNDEDVNVVGATAMGSISGSQAGRPPSNDGSVHAFVAKVDVETLEAVWTQQFYVQNATEETGGTSSAFGCSAVPPNQGFVYYVAGVTQNGATMDYPNTKSAGSDDIFVAPGD